MPPLLEPRPPSSSGSGSDVGSLEELGVFFAEEQFDPTIGIGGEIETYVDDVTFPYTMVLTPNGQFHFEPIEDGTEGGHHHPQANGNIHMPSREAEMHAFLMQRLERGMLDMTSWDKDSLEEHEEFHDTIEVSEIEFQYKFPLEEEWHDTSEYEINERSKTSEFPKPRQVGNLTDKEEEQDPAERPKDNGESVKKKGEEKKGMSGREVKENAPDYSKWQPYLLNARQKIAHYCKSVLNYSIKSMSGISQMNIPSQAIRHS